MKRALVLTLVCLLAVVVTTSCKPKVQPTPPPPQAKEQPKVEPVAPAGPGYQARAQRGRDLHVQVA